jgi:hypothetical protein
VNGVVTFGPNAFLDVDLSQNATQAAGQFWDFIWSDSTFVNPQNLRYAVTGLAAGLSYSIDKVAVGGGGALGLLGGMLTLLRERRGRARRA